MKQARGDDPIRFDRFDSFNRNAYMYKTKRTAWRQQPHPMTWTSPPPTWQRRHSPAEAEAAEAAATAAEAGPLAMEATAMAAEVPWASIGNLSDNIEVRRGCY